MTTNAHVDIARKMFRAKSTPYDFLSDTNTCKVRALVWDNG